MKKHPFEGVDMEIPLDSLLSPSCFASQIPLRNRLLVCYSLVNMAQIRVLLPNSERATIAKNRHFVKAIMVTFWLVYGRMAVRSYRTKQPFTPIETESPFVPAVGRDFGGICLCFIF